MPSSLEKKIEAIARKAREAAPGLANLSTDAKNRILADIADALNCRRDEIRRANQKDLRAAMTYYQRQRRVEGEAPWALPMEGATRAPMIDRLTLTDKTIDGMAQGLREVQALPDPVGEVVKSWRCPNGLVVRKVRIPLGVIGIIYESRPNVTIDAAGLCLKSGNAVVLRGGSEAIHSNILLGRIVRDALKKNGVDPNAVQVIDTPDRKAMAYLVRQARYLDLMIPRGGEALMKWMGEHSNVPVIKHDKGVCHVFVDEAANLDMAEKIAFNAKVQRPGVCNAMETLLVHEKIAPAFLPRMIRKYKESGVEIRGDDKVRRIVPGLKKATEKDWGTEYLDLILSIKVVSDLEQAIRHIRKYGSIHTESIVTSDKGRAEQFLKQLDSSVVLWNASTRFNDGGQLGLGAEIGISTTKLHAFGPMGLEELTATKFVVIGSGQIRE